MESFFRMLATNNADLSAILNCIDNPNDIAYVFSGYAPFSIRLVQQNISDMDAFGDKFLKRKAIRTGWLAFDIGVPKLIIANYKFVGVVATYFLSHVGGFAIQFVKSWPTRFGVATLFVTVATLLYLTGIGSYRKGTPGGSPLTTFFRVLIASCSKKSYALLRNANELYDENVDPTMPRHTNCLRCLDRAAIIVSNSTLEEQKLNRWKLCSVTEVQETKIFFLMIPLWINFAMLAETLIFFIWGIVRDKVRENRRKYLAPIGMAGAIVCSILCCITAASVERRRLDVVRKHGVMEKNPKDKGTIPMTMFWLIPQYVLLSALSAISSFCSSRFYTDQAPESLRDYFVDITLGVSRAGIMGSVVTVYAIGKVSAIGGNPSWFQDTINKSRLDKYYWSLAVLSSINLVLYGLVTLYGFHIEIQQSQGRDNQTIRQLLRNPYV
ncbi:Protein NRT1/ PTR FAMILY 5.5 [Glycine soja]